MERRPSPLPRWLKARLEIDGLMDPDTGATRRARARFCRRCSAHVFRGIDSEWGGMSRDCDPGPLDQLGEALALLDGRRTFELKWLGDRYELDTRNRFQIEGRPAGTIPGYDIVAEHDCARPGRYPVAPSRLLIPARRAAELPVDPPF